MTTTCKQCGSIFPAKKLGRRRGWQGYCSRSCWEHAVAFTPERFWANVDSSAGPQACWPWKKGGHVAGYGEMRSRGRLDRAHRIAYRLTHGEFFSGLVICHQCDNPRCCNPRHLRIGTPGDNVRDAVSRGRILRGSQSPNRRRLMRGEQHTVAKLTWDEVREIRATHVPRIVPARQLAQRYRVCEGRIYAIINRRTWAEVHG